MLRIIQNSDATSAKGYYSGRAEAGYYAGKQQQEMVGSWGGRSAEALGLHGGVDQRAFERLCDNRHPETGERLTARMRANRRVGYDFNFHACKSASLLYGLTGDPAILTAFRAAVAESMREIEAGIRVRVRKRHRHGERVAGNGVWAEFIHFTARPVAGVIDPHLHAHCFLLNCCFDPVEKIWKALDVATVKSLGERYQAAFQSRFAWKLMELGYPIERRGADWEVGGIDRDLIERFSGRTAQVEAYAAKHGITDAREKDRIGARTRERKRNDATMEELRREWWARLSEADRAGLELATLKRGFMADAPGRSIGHEAAPSHDTLRLVPVAESSPELAGWQRQRRDFVHRQQRLAAHARLLAPPDRTGHAL